MYSVQLTFLFPHFSNKPETMRSKKYKTNTFLSTKKAPAFPQEKLGPFFTRSYSGILRGHAHFFRKSDSNKSRFQIRISLSAIAAARLGQTQHLCDPRSLCKTASWHICRHRRSRGYRSGDLLGKGHSHHSPLRAAQQPLERASTDAASFGYSRPRSEDRGCGRPRAPR